MGDRDFRRTVRQSFIMARTDALYNAIFGRPVLNELCVILSHRYLMMKFEITKRVASVKGDQVEARRRCMLVAKVAIKQPKVIILETSEE